MKKKLITLVTFFIIGIGLQAAAYVYLDQVLFAPLASHDYDVSNLNDKKVDEARKNIFSKIKIKGKAYYSHDYQYMADVTEDSVTIYNAGDLSNPQNVVLKGQGVSYFDWMPDRNLALMALYPKNWKGGQ